MYRLFTHLLSLVLLGSIGSSSVYAAEATGLPAVEPYCEWQLDDFQIRRSLCGLKGDANRGKAIVADSGQGNCLACHELPIEGIEAFGTIGPPLAGVATRLPVGHMRLRVVDTRSITPMSIMPGYYRKPELIHRPGKQYAGRTFLSAQQVEDVIAYLLTLK